MYPYYIVDITKKPGQYNKYIIDSYEMASIEIEMFCAELSENRLLNDD